MEQEELIAYEPAAVRIEAVIMRGQALAAQGINRHQLATYYAIGGLVSRQTRSGAWSCGALEAISELLHRRLPGLRGFNASNLKNMRMFHEAWANFAPITIGDTKAAKPTDETVTFADLVARPEFPADDFFRVPFTHHCRLLERVKDTRQRLFYLHQCAEEHLSVEALLRSIAADTASHAGELPNNFARSLTSPEEARRAALQFKDAYLLDFINLEELGVSDEADVDERLLERGLVRHIREFIMAVGRDFAFVGEQLHLEAYGVEHFPDLVFFNRELNALVIIELKVGEFKSAYLGQLTAYLALADDLLRKPHENPAIGLVLCRSANTRYAEYLVRQYDRPLGVATYRTAADMPEQLRRALPAPEELEKLL